MKKIILVLMAIITMAQSDSVEEAFKRGQVSKKPVLVIVEKDGCPHCEEGRKRISRGFMLGEAVALYEIGMLDIDNNNYEAIVTDKAPSYFLFSPDGKMIAAPVLGLPADDLEFTDYLINTKVNYDFYLKNKAPEGAE